MIIEIGVPGKTSRELVLLRDRCPTPGRLHLMAPFGGFLGLPPSVIELDEPLARFL
jgi:hypothetical protein